ncbi:MAG: DUF4493 domain-containing protein [Bacteroidales bacterium]|nr:DUF4493 domain-containing protein [Bacteroidales bacterium]
MKKTLSFVLTALTAITALAFAVSCNELLSGLQKEPGTLNISFAEDFEPHTRAEHSPDINEFKITVTDPDGNVVYEGKYGTAPSTLAVAPGTYTVSAVSCDFSDPKFDSPQFGDTQVAVVESGCGTDVQLVCTQINSGVRLNVSPEFLNLYPDGILFLKSSDGKLMYGYQEKRTAYFNPGSIALILNDREKDLSLMTRTLEPRQILSVNITASSPGHQGSSSGISVSVDTSRNWTSEDLDIGGGKGGSDVSTAYSVAQARNHVGSNNVWVWGYIAGGDLTSSKCSFQPPFTSRTNIVLSPKTNCTDRGLCLSVQLAKGDVRDALNLVDHNDNLGRPVYLRGDIVDSYYGIIGLRNVTQYLFPED